MTRIPLTEMTGGRAIETIPSGVTTLGFAQAGHGNLSGSWQWQNHDRNGVGYTAG